MFFFFVRTLKISEKF